MRVKKVPLQDLELWPDEVICFTAYTDTRNPVQQRRTYVDGKKLKAENAELRDDLLLAQRIIGQISHEGFELIDENAKLRELVHAFDWCTENFDMPSKCEHCPLSQSDALNPECEVRMRELRIEVPE